MYFHFCPAFKIIEQMTFHQVVLCKQKTCSCRPVRSFGTLFWDDTLPVDLFGITLSEIHYERRKTEQVTLKANFMQF